MNLESQVCSLDLAKRLKELGVKQGSLFRWTYATAWSKSPDGGRTPGKGKDYIEYGNAADHRDGLAAFTVAELGEILPAHYLTVKSMEIENWWHCNKLGDLIGDDFKKGIIADTEADARAKMLIYLLENKLITL